MQKETAGLHGSDFSGFTSNAGPGLSALVLPLMPEFRRGEAVEEEQLVEVVGATAQASELHYTPLLKQHGRLRSILPEARISRSDRYLAA